MAATTPSTATTPRHQFDALMDEVKVPKADFNHMIMEYFVTHGYPGAAQKFAAEANMSPPLDVANISRRVEIRHAIHSGDIQRAIEDINEYNPQLLDENPPLHFALLRLQLIELIRQANLQPSADITPVINFAEHHLSPRASVNPSFLTDLEQTMALLIFRPGELKPPLDELLKPTLRRRVATEVNQALLLASGERAVATLANLISARAWAQQRVLKENKEDLSPENLDLGLDPPKKGSGAQSEDGDAMTTSWDGQS